MADRGGCDQSVRQSDLTATKAGRGNPFSPGFGNPQIDLQNAIAVPILGECGPVLQISSSSPRGE